ncbi:MAG: FAD-binding protein, partial [Chloroflexi bacterium]|nr:FAD-binding protein [Chloroflexota bacterium]
LTGILARAYDDLYVTVAAGTRLADLQAELAADGYLLPLAAPWPGATVGGTIAANFNAPWRGLYGSIRDLLLCAEVVLPDGRKLRLGRPLVKDVAGYALSKLFVGSFGVFGVLTAVSLRVFPKPPVSLTLCLPCFDLKTALTAGRALGRPAEYVSALLLLQNPGAQLLPTQAPYHVVSTVEGTTEDVTLAARESRRAVEQAGLPLPVTLVGVTGTDLWAQTLATSIRVLRAGISPGALPSLLSAMGTPDETPLVADLANGLLYVCHVPGTCEVPGTFPAMWEDRLRSEAIQLNGYSFTLGREVFPPRGFQIAPQAQRFARELKQRWDPAGVLNWGLM